MATTSIARLKEEAASCTACPLWQNATQTVFGEGRARADIMLVGEQPGDAEDKEGRPFVGPAGRLLDRALEMAGVDRSSLYVTNAVKHFKWEPRGKRRIHKKPNLAEIEACNPWLQAEMEAVKPRVVVGLGATAARAVLGKDFKVTRDRGTFRTLAGGALATATIHPSALVRLRDRDERELELKHLAADLAAAADRAS